MQQGNNYYSKPAMIIAAIIVAVILYLLGSLIAWSFNIAKWGIGVRIFIGILILIIMFSPKTPPDGAV